MILSEGTAGVLELIQEIKFEEELVMMSFSVRYTLYITSRIVHDSC